jgi:hypothetical protein
MIHTHPPVERQGGSDALLFLRGGHMVAVGFLKRGISDGFELWHRTRFVYRFPSSSGMKSTPGSAA